MISHDCLVRLVPLRLKLCICVFKFRAPERNRVEFLQHMSQESGTAYSLHVKWGIPIGRESGTMTELRMFAAHVGLRKHFRVHP
jgi:hypothetical protein